jgi:hypothetical protein
MWLDDCRIPTTENLNGGGYGGSNMGTAVYALSDGRKTLPTNKLSKKDYQQPQGRFTPNLLVCDDMLNDGSVSKAGEYKGEGSKSGGIWNNSTGKPAGLEYGDKGSNSRYYDLDLWFDKMIEKL